MTYLVQFFEAIDTPGGHICLLLGIMLYGSHIGSMELQVGATAALFLRLRSGGESSGAKVNGKESV